MTPRPGQDTRQSRAVHASGMLRDPRFLLAAILAASAATHLWNAAGFPDVFFDEGIYMRRAMHVLAGSGPQEGYFYDHPYFGQLFLAGLLGMTGYPAALHPSPGASSVAGLYLEPRVIMGILAVADTFLVYMIARYRYGTGVALASSVLFAVMPFTWLTRRILLDSILLPFLLLSVYLALCSGRSGRRDAVILLAGACLGAAIFTKVLIFVFIPLVAGIVYFYNGRRARDLALFLAPAVLVPSAWPAYAAARGELGLWAAGILYQTGRFTWGLPHIALQFLQMDPVLFCLGIAGISYCIARRDWLVLAWFAPFAAFLAAIGYNQYFYWIPVLPVFCIAGAVLLTRAAAGLRHPSGLPAAAVPVLCIAAFGLASTLLVVTTDMSHSQYEATAYLLQHTSGNGTGTTVLAGPQYSWVLNYVFHRPGVLPDYTMALYSPVTTGHVILVSDLHYRSDMARGYQLARWDSSRTVASFAVKNTHDMRYYPYTSLGVSWAGGMIEIKER